MISRVCRNSLGSDPNAMLAHWKFSPVCLTRLPFPSVANNSFLILATDDKSDVKYRLKKFSPGDLPVEKIVIAFGEDSFPVDKSSTGKYPPSAFIVPARLNNALRSSYAGFNWVNLSCLWPLIFPAFTACLSSPWPIIFRHSI